MIYGLRRGLWLLVQLMTDIVQQRGLGDLGKSLGLALKPTSEVQQVIGVGAQRTRRQLAKMLGIEKVVDPGDLMALLIEQAIGTSAGLSGGSMRPRPVS